MMRALKSNYWESVEKKINAFRKVSYEKLFLCLFVGLYIFSMFIAVLMKDHANNEWVRMICKEYVYGPKNILALVVNKVRPDTMEINSVFFPKQQSTVEIPAHEQAVKQVLDRYSRQKEIDEKLRSEYESGGYTLDDPFVVVNPYGISPLTALVMFDTDEEVQVAVKVMGNQPEENIELSIGGGQFYSKKHIVPVYGLYAGVENKVELAVSDKDNNITKKLISINTDELQPLLSNINLQTAYDMSKVKNIASGLNFSHSSLDSMGIKYAFDLNGNIRWYFSDAGIFGGTDYNDGKNVYRSIGSYYYGDVLILQESYLGRIEKLFYLPSGVHHDVHFTDEHTLLVTSHHQESLEDLGLEINIDNGEIINQIDYRKLLPRGRRIGIFHLEDEDWAHINAIVDYQGDYISSSNFQSAVFRHTKSGQIKWILSDPAEYATFWKQYILKPIGNNFEYPYNQHAVEVLPDYDNNPDTVDILLFDNGTSRNAMNSDLQRSIKLGKMIEPALYSRLVHYRINEKEMTVEQIWQYGKDRPELQSETRGDSDLLPNGNILGTFPHENGLAIKSRFPVYDTVYVEVNKEGDVLWECYASSNAKSNKYLDYRLCRTNIYNPSVDYSYLLDESHNFVPEEIMKKYGY